MEDSNALRMSVRCLDALARAIVDGKRVVFVLGPGEAQVRERGGVPAREWVAHQRARRRRRRWATRGSSWRRTVGRWWRSAGTPCSGGTAFG